ncbi:MAG: hypothetical protein QG597_443 [Actinomycetota bacterium]|nr:hypothetical protein [Actinomycetota bacterium]
MTTAGRTDGETAAPLEPPYRRATAWFTDRNWGRTLGVERLAKSRAIGRGVRVAIVLPVVMGILTALGFKQAAFLGAFAVVTLLVTSDFSGPRGERAASMASIATAGAVTLMLGILLADHVWLLLPTALVLGVGVVLLGALRGFLSQATVPVLLPFFIGATSVPTPDLLRNMVGGWFFGSGVAIAAAVTMWPYYPRMVLQESVAEAMRRQADAMLAMWAPGADAQTAAEPFRIADDAVSATQARYAGQLRRPGSAYRRERFLVRLVEETRRLRLGLRMAYRRLPMFPTVADQEVIAVTAASMRQAADVAEAATADLGPFRELDEARARHREGVIETVRADLAAADGEGAAEHATTAFRPRVMSLLAQAAVRDAGVMHGNQRVPHLTVRGQRLPTVVQQIEPRKRLAAQLSPSAPWMRNALRLGIAITVALAVVKVTGAERGYWVVLGTLSVLRMDLRGTGRSSWQVIQGQLLGFLIGLALIGLVIDRPWLAWLLLPLLAGLQGYMANNVSVVWQQAGFTALLVDMVSLSTPSPAIVLLRLEDVALGMVVAIAVSLLVFPRGLVPRVQESLLGSVTATSEFLVNAVEVIYARATGTAPTRSDLGDTAAHNALELTSETIDLALAQGIGQGARTMLWQRLLVLCEYVTYIADVVATVGRSYSADQPATRAGAEVLAVAQGLRPRLLANAEAVFSAADRAAAEGLETLPDYENVGEYSTAVEDALTCIDEAVARWAAEHRADMADPTIELYWTLGWLGEVDLMLANNHALLAEVANELRGRSEAASDRPRRRTTS